MSKFRYSSIIFRHYLNLHGFTKFSRTIASLPLALKNGNDKCVAKRVRFKYQEEDPPIFTSATIPVLLGLGIVFCDAVLSNKERRFFRAVQFGIIPDVISLLKEKVDVNMRHSLGWTPLMVAAVNGQCEIARLLLVAGADPNVGEEFVTVNRTANEKGLHPIEEKFKKAAQIPRGVGIGYTNNEVVKEVWFNSRTIMEILLPMVNVNTHKWQCTNKIVLMIREDEFSNTLNSKASFRGFTALHYATLINNLDMVKLLIEKGANPLAENDAGHTPLMYAKDGPVKAYLQEQSANYEELKKEKELEERRRFPLEERLRKYIVGQEGAITTVAASIIYLKVK